MLKKVTCAFVLAGFLAASAAIPAIAKTKHMSGGMQQFHDQVISCMAHMQDLGLSAKDTGRYMAMLTSCLQK